MTDCWQPTASIEVLQQKARILQSMRAFFTERNILEVDTPVLSTSAITDPYIESFSTRYRQQTYYLHTSPEFHMKRLLAAGSGDIYQIAKVFRDDENGRFHNPEFSLLEWYRLGFDHHQLMDEVEALITILMPDKITHFERISYQQAFLNQLDIDPLEATVDDLKTCAKKHQIETPQGLTHDKDMWLDWLMVAAIAPGFSARHFTFLYDYPASQASLAQLDNNDPRLANRFELFYGELELANGFNELTHADEQLSRFQQDNKIRQQRALKSMPIDRDFLQALQSGLPKCSGVALGIDRMIMVLLTASHINDVMSFANRVSST